MSWEESGLLEEICIQTSPLDGQVARNRLRLGFLGQGRVQGESSGEGLAGQPGLQGTEIE